MITLRNLLRRWLLTDAERATLPLDLSQWLYNEQTKISVARQKANNHENRISTLERLAKVDMEFESEVVSRCMRKVSALLDARLLLEKPKKPKKSAPVRKPKK